MSHLDGMISLLHLDGIISQKMKSQNNSRWPIRRRQAPFLKAG